MRKLFARIAFLSAVAFATFSVADGGDAIFVKEIEGRGKDHQAALADAFQNAIRKALGTYVVTHSTTDGETLDEKIYLNSDAVVKSYKVVGREDGEGFVSLLIEAEIVRNEMMKYIHREASEKVEGGELANLLAKRKAIESAVKSLDLLFLDYRENLYRVEKYGTMSIAPGDDLSGDKIMVSVPFIVTFRWDAYRVWREKLTQLLDRIAIAKTTGRSKDRSAFDDFYEDSGFFEKNGAGGDNPNGYRGVLFLDGGLEWQSPISYSLYIVPSQIHRKLVALLDSEIDFRFTFTSPGGNDIVSFSTSGEVWFFQSSQMSSFNIWNSLDHECLIFRDSLLVEAGHRDSWTVQNLFHATIPVPESAVEKINGCIIRCIPRSDRDSYSSREDRISRTPLSKAEWQSIDPGRNTIPTPTPASHSSPTDSPTIPEEGENDETTSADPIPEFENVLKALTVVRVSPTFENMVAVEKNWERLPGHFRSLLQTNVLNASCASFFAQGNNGAVAKRKSRIDANSLWNAVTDECRFCQGSGHSETKCFACGGSGTCSSCHGSGRLGGGKPLQGMAGAAASAKCSRCNGTGRCQSCTDGMRKTTCTKCDGRGRIVSKVKCKAVFEKNIEQAIRICYGTE